MNEQMLVKQQQLCNLIIMWKTYTIIFANTHSEVYTTAD